MKTGSVILCLLVALALQSCFKKDKLIPANPRGVTIPMTENYLYQLYFNLDSGKVVKSNVKTTSDLGFNCSKGGWRIILNTSDFMKAGDLGQVVFGQPHDTVGVKWKFDKSDGDPDSTAIGQWFRVTGTDTVSDNHVYVVNRGMDELGNELGFYQVVFDSLKGGTYYFRYARLSGGTIQSASVHKEPAVSYLWFSLKDNVVKPLEPLADQFDLLFTQYTTMLYDAGAPYPYLVTGVLINRNGVEAAFDSTLVFADITREVAQGMKFSTNLDAVGYIWKYYNFSSGVYKVRPQYCYVVKNISGVLYKLHFLGFYNNKCEKGYPVIEYQQL
ncbi:MAG: HmuY family protein [Bacteroidota bacterium]